MGLDMYLSKMRTPKEKGGDNPYSYKELTEMFVDRRTITDDELASYQSNINLGFIYSGEGYFSNYIRGLQDIGYWRKANQIHNWFVKNVQNGVDNCEYYIVSKEQLGDLLSTCQKVLAASELVDGQIINGYSCNSNYELLPNYEDGQIISNSSIAEELLPTSSGFFFGGTEYDEYYYSDIKDTIEILEDVLKTTDFNKYTILYHSSW